MHTSRISYFSYTVPPPTSNYTLSLHDALPILISFGEHPQYRLLRTDQQFRNALEEYDRIFKGVSELLIRDRKSTRLNSSHVAISYAVFCLKKKNIKIFYHGFHVKISHQISVLI